MDEQQSMFFYGQFNEDQYNGNQSFKNQSGMHEMQSQVPKKQLTLKAFNPMQYAENLPLKDQQKFVNRMLNSKKYSGLSYFINFEKNEQIPEFLTQFKAQDYSNKDWIQNPLHLQDLFQKIDPETFKKRLQDVEEQVNSLTKKTFNHIDINHIIIHNFNDNFDNFIYLNSHINFIKDLEIKIINFIEHVKTQQYGYELIVKIFQFWMKAFEEFILSIKKHTERYTLSMAKKIKGSESNSNQEGKSTSSSKIMQAEKRRSWKSEQLERLEKLISSNSAYNQSLINKLAEELNRTPASVSSKIQKLIKDHRSHNPDYEIHENMTVLEKIINVLKNYPQGLSKQSVIERVNEHYEMGYDANWSRSVGQILSSRAEFARIKGTYSLNGHFKFDMSKKTFKDKVVNCLLAIPEGKASLKRIVDQYISLYGTTEGISILSEERMKTIEASISKSLSRYDIFNKDNSKTIYKLREFCNETDFDSEIVGYLS